MRNQAEGIIDEGGRVKNTIGHLGVRTKSTSLSQFSSIVERLTRYTNYLENMSSRLSHELRTPVTVVRSSIENLVLSETNKGSKVYLERAEEGISRLNLILTNIVKPHDWSRCYKLLKKKKLS